MAQTEATFAEQPVAPAEPLDPLASAWLPLTTGDTGLYADAAEAEHGWPGRWFIFLTNVMAIGMEAFAVAAALGLVIAVLAGEMGSAALAAMVAVGLALGCVVQGSLARHVKEFSRWGWWGAMAELALAALTKLNVALTQSEPDAWSGAAVWIVVDLLWMGYFWERRGDFDV